MFPRFQIISKNDKLTPMIETLKKENIIYRGKAVNFCCDEVFLPNGQVATREYLKHPGAAAVLPFLDKENIILVQQYRYPISKLTYEIPAGKMDKGETPLNCIKRELQEETGYTSNNIEKVLSFYPSTAFSNEVLHIFSAFDLKPGKTNPDEDEFVDTIIMKYKDALKMVKDGQIMDSKTIIALLYFENILK